MTEAMLIGYTLDPNPQPVFLEEAHTLVCGMTGKAGKSTTVDGIISRWPNKCFIVFTTKRDEIPFTNARTVRPFFKQPGRNLLWRYVEGMIEMTLEGEKQRTIRPVVLKVCKNSSNLSDVQAKVKSLLMERKGREDWFTGQLELLEEYLRIVIDEIQAFSFSQVLEAHEYGTHIMNLGAFSPPMQNMIIGAVADEVMQNRRDTILVIPEAWEKIPNSRNTPAKRPLQDLAKKGRSVGNFLIVDSQTIVDVDPSIRKQIGNYILGKQPEDIEASKTIRLLPIEAKDRPRVSDIQTLKLGQYYAVIDGNVSEIYARPAWMDAATAIKCAQDPGHVYQLSRLQGMANKQQLELVLPSAPSTEDPTLQIEGLEKRVNALEDDLHQQALENTALKANLQEKTELTETMSAELNLLRHNLSAYSELQQAMTNLVKSEVDDYLAIKANTATIPASEQANVNLQSPADIKLNILPPAEIQLDESTTEGKLCYLILTGLLDSWTRKKKIHDECLKHWPQDINPVANNFYRDSLNEALIRLASRPWSLLELDADKTEAKISERGKLWKQENEKLLPVWSRSA